jgi:hypothetical protein
VICIKQEFSAGIDISLGINRDKLSLGIGLSRCVNAVSYIRTVGIIKNNEHSGISGSIAYVSIVSLHSALFVKSLYQVTLLVKHLSLVIADYREDIRSSRL